MTLSIGGRQCLRGPPIRRPVPLWTSPAFDRCLLIASIYPLTSIIFIWSVSGDVGSMQELLRLRPAADLHEWRRFLQVSALALEIFSIWSLVRTKSWSSAAWAVAGGALAISASVFAIGRPHAAGVFLLAGAAAAAVGLIFSRVPTSILAFNTAVSGVGVVAGVIIGASACAARCRCTASRAA